MLLNDLLHALFEIYVYTDFSYREINNNFYYFQSYKYQLSCIDIIQIAV